MKNGDTVIREGKGYVYIENCGVKYFKDEKGLVLHPKYYHTFGFTKDLAVYYETNIPPAYRALRYAQLDIRNDKADAMFNDKDVLKTNSFIFIQGEVSAPIGYAFLNESFLNGVYPIHCTSGYQFIEKVIAGEVDFFDKLGKAKLLAIDAFDAFLNMPPKYRKTIIYYLEAILNNRDRCVLPTVILANTFMKELSQIVGVSTYSILKKNLKYKI